MMIFITGFVLVIISYNYVQCELCDVKDVICTTKRANDNFPLFINGVDNLIDSSDPLFREKIVANLPTITYTFRNATFSGLKDCEVKKLDLSKSKTTFEYEMECPKITVRADYVVKGNVASFYVEGEGPATIICNDYVFNFKGNYEIRKGTDGKGYAYITDFEGDVEAQHGVIFDFKNLYYGDKEKSDLIHNFINQNWKEMDKQLRKPAIKSFMSLLVEHFNAFLAAIPVETALSF